MSLENSAKNAEDPSASVPLADPGEETPGEVAGKPETKENKAVTAFKKAQAEGNKAEHEGNKAETKAPPSFRATPKYSWRSGNSYHSPQAIYYDHYQAVVSHEGYRCQSYHRPWRQN